MNQNHGNAIILAGGVATFNGLTLAPCPKSLLPIANRPLAHYLARALAGAGVKRLIFCVAPKMGEAADRLLAAEPPSIPYVVRETIRGSGGTLGEVDDLLTGESFWVVNGDLLLDTDLSQMLALHQERQSMATVGVMKVLDNPWWMERVEPGDDDAVRAIHRIHPAQERRSVMRPVGLYLFQNAVLDFVPSEGYFDLKEQLFPPLHAQGLTTVMWQVSGYCRTITSLEDYFFANQDVLMGHMKPLPAAQGDPGGAAAAGLPASSKALPPLAMGEDVQVGEEALLLGPTAIGAKTVIGKGAIVNECVILDHASVGRGVYLDSCIVCREGAVKDGLILRETALAQDGGGAAADAGLALRERARLEQEATPWQAPVGVPWYSRVKRFIDIIFSSLTLVLLAPLMLVVAIAIKLDSEGPVFYQQERNGLHGRRFIMYKFRSMVPDADDLRRELQAVNEVDGPMFKLTHDPRVTRVGKFLRDTNIDELPQLWNVLKGDMSLVGPRPLSMDEMRYNPRWRDARLSVRPGMTGMWQVEAHTKLEFNDWLRHDIEYVQHQSVGLDTWILWKTAVKVVHDLIDKIRGVEKDRI